MKTVLGEFIKYKVELDNDCNNLANIDVLRTHVNSGLYFVYKLVSFYNTDENQCSSALREEVFLASIEANRIACKLLNNYVRLRLKDLLATKHKLPPCVIQLALDGTSKGCSLLSSKILDKVREFNIDLKDRALYGETIATPIERLVNECSNMVSNMIEVFHRDIVLSSIEVFNIDIEHSSPDINTKLKRINEWDKY